MSFDASAILRDIGSASTLTASIAQLQKEAAKAINFDASAILTFDSDRAQAALERQDASELESLLPKVVGVDLPQVAAGVVIVILLHLVGSTVAELAVAAAEFGAESVWFLLESLDLLYAELPSVRGLFLLLNVVAAVVTIRAATQGRDR